MTAFWIALAVALGHVLVTDLIMSGFDWMVPAKARVS